MGMGSRLKRLLVPALLIVASTAVGLSLAEAALRTALEPGDFIHPEVLDDPVLGVLIKPHETSHDALGFRNEKPPPKGAVIALGDSQTYGMSAPRNGSWPAQLGALLGEPVYNMGMPGFGPLQYLEIARSKARELQPKVLVAGLYLGNDFMDAYYVAQDRPHWHAWRRTVKAAGAATPFHLARTAEPQKRFGGVRKWLSANSMLYCVLKATLLAPFAAAEQKQLAKDVSRDVQMSWVDPSHSGVRTIFTPAYRLSAMDDAIPSVSEGIQISRAALQELRAEALRQGVRLLVVLIPTKEGVYCDRLRQTGAQLPADFVRLCDAEVRLRREFDEFMTAGNIAHLDAQPALARAAAQGQVLYPQDSDGHPRAAGYAVIAQEVAGALRRLSK